MSIRPLQDRVVVRRTEEETKSAGGIVIPDSAAEKPSQGEVIAVGPGKKLDNGSIQSVDLIWRQNSFWPVLGKHRQDRRRGTAYYERK